MSALTITVLRLGLLVLLWIFVLGAIGVLRRDLFGTRLMPRATRGPEPARAPTPAPEPTLPQSSSAGRGVPRTLVVVEGSMTGTTIDLSAGPILVGRAPECTLVLSDDYSSGRHLRIYPDQGAWYAEDLASTNGTFIGRERVHGSVPVHAGTQLRIGRTVLELRR